MARKKPPLEMPKKFVQMPSGAVYGFAPMLAKRRGAVVVSGQQAADYLRSIGATADTNPLCEAFPPIEDVVEKPARKSKAAPSKKRKAAPTDEESDDDDDAAPAGLVMSDRPMTESELKAALDGVSNSE